ncbi:hypothetical protein J2847_003736 [Azospirillum agricola]|nr:hypothetical protein [Azospirillum agricola]
MVRASVAVSWVRGLVQAVRSPRWTAFTSLWAGHGQRVEGVAVIAERIGGLSELIQSVASSTNLLGLS